MAGGINNIGNLLGKVDSNNALVVALASGSTIDAPVFTGQASFADGSTAAPSITFASDTDTGWYRGAAGNEIIAAVGGVRGFGVYRTAGVNYAYTDGVLSVGSALDVLLTRDVANTLALRNSTNAQRLNLGQGDTALAAGSLAMGRDAAAAFAPGAGYGLLRWESGTNAGTLKLVAYSGTSTTGVTVVDNVGGGNA